MVCHASGAVTTFSESVVIVNTEVVVEGSGVHQVCSGNVMYTVVPVVTEEDEPEAVVSVTETVVPAEEVVCSVVRLEASAAVVRTVVTVVVVVVVVVVTGRVLSSV